MAEAVGIGPHRAALGGARRLLSIFVSAVLNLAPGNALEAEPPRAAAGEARPNAQSNPPAQLSPRELVGDQPPVDISSALPKVKEMIGAGGMSGDGAAGVRKMTSGKVPSANFRAGIGRTKVYGIEAEGFKFIYCFDHSDSMGGPGHSPLRAAKAELLASLDQLGPTHSFQIIFYNDHPTIFNITGQAGRLVFGTEQNKQQARQFVEGIKASGGTDHQAALDMAVNLGPDVIFFLTDADQPEMSPGQLARIRRRNPGAVINTIKFGEGPATGYENFLMRLARENGGSYKYIDVTQALRETKAGHE